MLFPTLDHFLLDSHFRHQFWVLDSFAKFRQIVLDFFGEMAQYRFFNMLENVYAFFNIVKYIRWDGLNLHANETGFATQTFHSNAHICVWDHFFWYAQNVLQTVSLKTKYNQGHGCLEPQPKNHKF